MKSIREATAGSIIDFVIKMNHDNIIEKIINLNTNLCVFWSNASGWAPDEAADLMSKSRLDRQVSLSKCLAIWSHNKVIALEEGALILAWANLGSLIEGTLKLFLAVYYDDYQKDIEAFRDYREGHLIGPDVLPLEKLRVFFKKKRLLPQQWDKYIQNVQHYRNAIHAFRDKEIGTFKEFEKSIYNYLLLMREINSRLPYPDDAMVPGEIL